MERNLLLKIRKKFISKICEDILTVLSIILYVLFGFVLILVIENYIIAKENWIFFLVLMGIIIVPISIAFLYYWIKKTWVLSREQIENGK